AGILIVTTVEKFAEGGFMTILITGIVIAFCLLNHAHYAKIRRKLRAADAALEMEYPTMANPPAVDAKEPTAVFVVGSCRSGARLGQARVSRPFSQFRFHDRAHGRREVLRRLRGARPGAAS